MKSTVVNGLAVAAFTLSLCSFLMSASKATKAQVSSLIWRRSGDDIYVRSAHGSENPWYVRALASETGRIRAGAIERDVLFEPAADISHALYASHVERTEVFLHEDELGAYPAGVARHARGSGPGPWRRLWSSRTFPPLCAAITMPGFVSTSIRLQVNQHAGNTSLFKSFERFAR